ncbi:MAG TPA: hypothetical protein VFR67_25585 [Pilimelia sp.]|nr:hypothetical protein [Pilimelia sp.]
MDLDADRLVALATDPARHDRMLDLTGGDAAALARHDRVLVRHHGGPGP